jgi:hypothetical protein
MMRLKKGYVFLAAFAIAVGVGAFFVAGCEEDIADITRPKVEYKDQTFSLLVCDGNGNAPTSWDHDGAAVCTLDWNGDGSGPNALPVTYVYDEYPLIDGVSEQRNPGIAKGGDYWLWETTPWTVIKTQPILGGGSGVTEVWVKALYTYVNPPRIWFFFRWEDPSHTIQPVQPKSEYGKVAPVGGTMEYYWYQMGGFPIPGDGFKNNRTWASHEDWLALVWSTWFLWNTNDKGKPKNLHSPANPDGYDWLLVETVPDFQTKGINLLKGSGEIVYRTPPVTSSDANSPYFDAYYPGPVCDFWYFSASRTNYTAAGSWLDTEAAYLFDCHINKDGFKYPPVGQVVNPTGTPPVPEWLPFDSGIAGYESNGGQASAPPFMAPSDPVYNPPGAYYIWKGDETSPPFSVTAPWPAEGGARITGYRHRAALGGAADIICRCQWQQPNRMWYDPWEGENGERYKEKPNYYGKDWNYTLEIMRDIGTITKIDPEEDVLLGLFDPHPGR